MSHHRYQKCLAEFIGTFALIFFGCGSIMTGSEAVPLIFGAIVATMIYAVGHISGAHFNPAVTFAFAITRHFPVNQVLPYWLAQCAGAIAAMSLLAILIPATTTYGATIPTTSHAVAFCWEFVLSAFLMFVIIAVATDTRAEGMMAGIAIGTMVALCAYLGGPFTGASMNPARSLAPALYQGTLGNLWLYFTAPFLGTACGALLYQQARCEDVSTDAKGCC